eukprot:GILK01003358.1.p1 GENE.GILK01003358.1~~GILK01003358.1.p1  ORF type:complete len:193 (-),score=16.77 GILK01003358.1:69-608(-)
MASPGTVPVQEAPTKNLLAQSAHPIAAIFHIAFKLGALLTYIFSSDFVITFVIIILMVAFDFWTVKNITGRLMVGLRWWNEVKEDGTSNWVFESAENKNANSADSKIFWTGVIAYPVVWGVFLFIAVFSFKFMWAVVVIVAMSLACANLVGYAKCRKGAKKQLQGMVAKGLLQTAMSRV